MANTNTFSADEWNLRRQLQRDTEAWLRTVRDGDFWRRLPNEANPQFFTVAMRASRAVQATLRRAIGAYYFESVDAYRDWRTAFAVLVYSVSHVFSGCPRTEYAYDIHCTRTIRRATSGTDAVVALGLASIEKRLMEAGELGMAAHYAPHRCQHVLHLVRTKYAKTLLAMLRADEILITATIQLVAMAAELRDKPIRRDADLKDVAADYVRSMHRQLRKFRLGIDLSSLAPELLTETVNAVTAAIARLPEPALALAPEEPRDLAA